MDSFVKESKNILEITCIRAATLVGINKHGNVWEYEGQRHR